MSKCKPKQSTKDFAIKQVELAIALNSVFANGNLEMKNKIVNFVKDL